MWHNVDPTLVLALGALALSCLTPLGFLILQRRIRTQDDRMARKSEDARRKQVAADALRRARSHLVTAGMEYELEAVQAAIRASEDAVLLKEQGGIPVLTETLAAISAMKEQAHAVEVEIVERKEHGV
jgi:hypothetical protein